MTVKDLIARLQEFPDETVVRIWKDDYYDNWRQDWLPVEDVDSIGEDIHIS